MNDNEFSYETEEQEQKKSRMNAKGYAFLAFFIIMMAAIFITGSKGNTTACVICFGIFFFVVGIFAFFTPKPSFSKAPLLVLPLAGAAAIIIPLVKEYTDFTVDTSKLPIDLTALLIFGVFFLIGLGFLISPTANYLHKKQKYTPVMAVCKGLDMRYSRSKKGGRRKVYAPLWEYYWEGEFISIQSNVYSNIDVPHVGEEYELYINPDDPKKFYRPSLKTLIFFIVFGSIWTIFSMIPLIAS